MTGRNALADSQIVVGRLEPGEEAAWEAFVRAHPDATPYHFPAWSTVTREGLGHRPAHLCARAADGRIIGVLPLFEVRGVFGRRLVSMPMRDRGGPLAEDDHTAAALVAEAITVMRARRCSYLELKSANPLPDTIVESHKLVNVRHWITTRVDLSIGTERLWKGLDRNAVRWAINNARRNGVRVERDDSAEGIDRFYRLFSRTRQSMGIPPFPRRLFEAIHEHLIRHDLANLFFVYHDDTPINGLISVYWGDTMLPAYAAPQNEWRKSYPSEVAFWHTIEWAVARGLRVYDFGADSPHQEGLLRFKRKWGGVHQPMSFYYHLNGRSSPPEFDSSSPVYRAMRRVWSVLPAPVGRALGGLVTRQLS